ncbi:MAG: hypothetical protein WC683_08235 [bacterium]
MKSNAGAPPREGRTQRVAVYLTPEDAAYLEAMPVGSLSAAVRECIAWYRQTYSPAFLLRCEQAGRAPADVISEMMWGYATMPTAAEVREAIERGPEDE